MTTVFNLDSDSFPVIRKTSSFVFWNRARIFIMILTLICLTLSQINSLTFTFTVICMDDVVEEFHRSNQTGQHFMESSTQKAFLFSGPAIGATIGLIPATPLLSRFGVRKVLTFCGICSAFGSFLFPISVASNYYLVVFCRILQGIGISVIYTAVAVIPGQWSPNNEIGTFLAVLSCALQISNVICMSVSGILCESSFGWRSIYYIFGISTFVFYAIFFFTHKDNPTVHRNVSHKELSQIQNGKAEIKKREAVPYKAILFDRTVITCIISSLGGNLGFFMLVLYGPTYLKAVLNFRSFTKIVAAQISDRLTFVSEKSRFVFFATISQVGMAAGFAVLAWTSNRVVAQIAYTFAIVTSGINVMGVVKCLQLEF
ncbi:unnamed protein product [Caenorhabditis angaria]|uniref:Major facilitator superfamily (MFS) profile domain-containing protein n=1 Tax=Caenorhabditis angaria TaxID=860376 RepID=A0A9P1IVQ4_9PELO|nr:unnamed protein product [Caenorhabditis angaria]